MIPYALHDNDGCVDFEPVDAARPVHFVLRSESTVVEEIDAAMQDQVVSISPPGGFKESGAGSEYLDQVMEAVAKEREEEEGPTDVPVDSMQRADTKQLLDNLAQRIAAVDSDKNGHVSEEELAATIFSSALWVEEDKHETLAAAIDLLAVDAALATEMVADGATAAVMRRLAQESARLLNQPIETAEAAHPQDVEGEANSPPGTGGDGSGNGNAP
jgi:hypothetical protein